MKLSFPPRKWIPAVAGAAMLAATPLAPAADDPAAQVPVSPARLAHEEALAKFFLGTRVVQIARRTALAAVKPGYQRQLVEYYLRHHDDAALAAAYAAEIGAMVSPLDSAGALRVAQLPQMRQMMAEYEKQALGMAPSAFASATIRRLGSEVERAGSPADLQAIARLTPLSKGMVQSLARRIKAQDDQLARHFKTRLVEMVTLSVKQGLTLEEIPRTRLGFEPIDKVFDIYAASLERMVVATEKQAQARARLEFDTLLEPRYLVDRAGIERGRAMVELEASIGQTYLAEIQDMYTIRVEQLRVAMGELPGYVDREINNATVGRIEHLLATSENYQRRTGVYRRMLGFAEARLGQTALEGDKLVFPSEQDRAIWIGMAGEVEELGKQDALRVQALQTSDRQGIDGLQRRGSAPPSQ